MGMDVIGKKKESYFRNNFWWWRPLWSFCTTVAPTLCAKVKSAGSNDGDGLDAEDSKALAKLLKESIANGACAKYEQQYNTWRASLPRERCKLCNATGIRADKIGTDAGMPNRELSIEQIKALGRTQGWCNGCDGVGTEHNMAALYPFSVDNVMNFAEFLEECEGFEIW